MLTVAVIQHTCDNIDDLLVLWKKGRWFAGIEKVTECPKCQEVLPDVGSLNKVEAYVSRYTTTLKSEVEYVALSLSQKERKPYGSSSETKNIAAKTLGVPESESGSQKAAQSQSGEKSEQEKSVETSQTSGAERSPAGDGTVFPKRGRGRPRKHPIAPAVSGEKTGSPE